MRDIRMTTKELKKIEVLALVNKGEMKMTEGARTEKTRIIYCKDGQRKGKYPNKSFDFLGYTFRARVCKNRKKNILFVNFTPAVSKKALKTMRATTRKKNIRNRTDLSLVQIAKWYNPILQGWMNYYGCYTRSGMYPVL